MSYEIQSDYTVPEFLGDERDRTMRAIAEIATEHSFASLDFRVEQYETEWDELDSIQNSVREKVTFSFEDGRNPWIAGTTGNCFTHAFRLAETLKQSGFDAGIAFCNDHGFVLARSRDPQSGKVYMLNVESRSLSLGDITSHPDKMIFSHAVTRQIAEQGFSDKIVTTTQTGMLQRRSKVLREKSIGNRKAEFQNPWVADSHPATVIMSLEEANRSLFYYSCFKAMLGARVHDSKRHVAEVTSILGLMEEHNPQQETRSTVNFSLGQFKKQIRLWAVAGVPSSELEKVIDAYAQTMPSTFSRDIFVGDVCRTAAKNLPVLIPEQVKSLLTKSVQSYRGAAARAVGGDVAIQKVNSCVRDARRLGIEGSLIAV